jgi:hypothetical protein
MKREGRRFARGAVSNNAFGFVTTARVDVLTGGVSRGDAWGLQIKAILRTEAKSQWLIGNSRALSERWYYFDSIPKASPALRDQPWAVLFWPFGPRIQIHI